MRRYVHGLLSDSARKSMEAMLARVTDPGSYQAFQHFITDSPWSADRVWRRLRALLPEREGVLIFDGTSFPKQGTHSVGVARQYCGALGKVANCQVAVTAALWTGVRAYLLGAALDLPEPWLTDAAREPARIPASVRFQEKWRQALTLLRQVLLRAPAGDDLAPAARPVRASAVGDRAAVSRVEDESRARPFRRPHVSRLAPSRRPHRHHLQLLAGRTPAAPRRADLPSGTSHRSGDLHGVPIRSTSALPQTHRGVEVGATANLTK